MTDRANINLWVSAELKTAIRRAAAQETVDTGERVSVQAWVRRACEGRLAQEVFYARKLGDRDG